MPMRDFRCAGCGHEFEALSRDRGLHPVVCGECGGTAPPVLSRFGLKVYQVDRSNFALIAPLDRDGKPLTFTKTQRLKTTGTYDRTEAGRVEEHDRQVAAQDEKNRQERAKREGWRIVSAKTRTVV